MTKKDSKASKKKNQVADQGEEPEEMVPLSKFF
jgi:hypothetical protein